jgi:hypothetical protein
MRERLRGIGECGVAADDDPLPRSDFVVRCSGSIW